MVSNNCCIAYRYVVNIGGFMKKKQYEELQKLLAEYEELGMPDYGTRTTAEDFVIWVGERQFDVKGKSKWIKNTGSIPDLPHGTEVKVKFRDGATSCGVFAHYNWRITESVHMRDIMKYKVVKE